MVDFTVSGKLVFVGGDEFRAGCRSMDSHLLAFPQITNVRVLIVPAAAADSRPEMAAENGVEYFHSLGAHASSAMVLQPSDAEDNALISSVDAALSFFTIILIACIIYSVVGINAWFVYCI